MIQSYQIKKQSKSICVKCRMDGELPSGRRTWSAVYALHPAVAHNRYEKFENTCYAASRTTAKEVIFMRKMMKTKQYVMMAMMIAVYMILSRMILQIGGLKLTFEHFPVLFCAIVYGPAEAMLVGGISELLDQMLSFGFTPTTLLWVLPIVVRGFIVGTCANAFKKQMKPAALIDKKLPVFFTGVCVFSGIVSSLLNTLALYVDSRMFGYYSFALVFGALAVRLMLSVLTSIGIVLLMKPVLHALDHAKLI